MSASLGEKLRQAREERGISISEVAEQTRISSLYLKAIEDDNYKPLPGGIFNKGFVKAYAKYVGMDEQEALRDYARLVSQAEEGEEDLQPKYRPEVLTDDRSASSMAPTIVFAGIILALMTGGILFVVNYIQNQGDAPAGSNNSANGNVNAAATNSATNPDSAPTPVPNEIRVEFTALSERVSVSSTVDGTVGYDDVEPGAPKTYAGQQAVRIRYYRGFADKVRISLNGKQITPPAPPARGNIEFEINRDNISRIFESGQIAPGESPAQATPAESTPQSTPAPTATPTRAPAATSTPRPSPTSPRPAFTQQPSPRRSPTPIVVGRPPAARPSPN